MNLRKLAISGMAALMVICTFSTNIAAKSYLKNMKAPGAEPNQEMKRQPISRLQGTISKVEDNCIYVKLPDGREIKVNLTDKTRYYAFRGTISKTDLTAGKFVAINAADPDKITPETKEITALEIAVRPPVVKGTITSVQGSEIIIQLEDGTTKKLITDKDTKIYMTRGEPFQGKLTPGMKLFALVDSISDVMQARAIRIHE